MAVLQNGTTQVLQTRDYNPGTFTSPAVDMQVGQSKVVIAADRNNWPDTGDAVIIDVKFDISLDGGNNWQVLAGFTAPGGGIGAIDPWGNPVTQSWFAMNAPEPDNPNRKIRSTVKVLARLNTAVSITVS